MENFRASDWVGMLLIALVGLGPILATVVVAWWILLGGGR
jgi:hypothetical protein